MYRQEKSILTYQVEGRLSAYLSDIDDCEEFSLNSQTKLTKTMKITECIHSLLDHIIENCVKENTDFIRLKKITINIEESDRIKYNFKWIPLRNSKCISGVVELNIFGSNFDKLNYSNFKADTIQSITNLIIDYFTLTYSKSDTIVEEKLFIIKVKKFEKVTSEFTTRLKTEIEECCGSYCNYPTFIYLKHKDNVGHFHQHFSNFNLEL